MRGLEGHYIGTGPKDFVEKPSSIFQILERAGVSKIKKVKRCQDTRAAEAPIWTPRYSSPYYGDSQQEDS